VREADNLARVIEPDVIVLDIIMPDVDGVEIVQRLATDHYGGHAIITSGCNPRYARSVAVSAR
jgi:YesN/AraC family two-component response regulator